MKVPTFLRFLSTGSLLLFVAFSGQAQNESFNIKKHKDTILDKSELNAIQINRDLAQTNSLVKPRYGNINSSIASKVVTNNFKKSANTEVVIAKETGLPIFISTPSTSNANLLKSSNDIKATCYDYLNSIGSITKITNPSQDFEIKNTQTDALGKTHVKLIQKYKGVKVYSSEVYVHLNSSKIAETFNGNYHVIKSDIDVKPTITTQAAINTVLTDLATKTTVKQLTEAEKMLLNYSSPEIDTIIYEDRTFMKIYVLAYQISIYPNLLENWDYFVDAKSGVIIKSIKNTCHVDGPRTATANDLNNVSRIINTYQEGSNYLLIDASKPMFNATSQNGAIITLDANNTFGNNFKVQPIISLNNTWNYPTAVSAHYNAGVAYDYFKNVHGRNSIDGNGGTIYSIINKVDEDGSALDNAFWNGKAMFYGNGNTDFKPLAGGLDVAGHEMTHGVVQNTAGLKYEGESGAINESMSDIFGSMMDSTNWLIGEDVVKLSAFPSGALRSLSDPHNGGSSLGDNGFQPRHMNEKYNGSADHGGVHINSGIPNWAFYKFATALNSRKKAALVFYRALTTYLTASSQFIDLRIAVIQSAKDLYGNTSNEATQAGIAFDAVGITDGTGGVYTTALPVNPGTEYLLSYDTDISNTNGLYRSTPSATNFNALLTKSVYNKPSVTDDGEGCVFVGTDKKLYVINVNPSKSLNLTTLQNQPIWSSVSVSKDGSRLAAITYDKDTSIYVYDFGKSQWARFKLYNPTFSEGITSAGPVYADAIEWSYDGESLIYDCFNNITNTSGSNIEYWDINIIKVWDNSSNDFADGEIFKLFNNLEEGESIGNPCFSKNSPYILAFDYVNEISDTYGIVGLDLEQNKLDAIALNNTIGWPSFNKNDSRVAFTSIDGSGNSDINYVTLNTDKISSNGVQSKLIDDAMWPVYYTVGVRDISTDISEELVESSETLIYPNPTKNELNIVLPKIKSYRYEVQVFNQLGQLMLSKSYNNQINEILTIGTEELPNGLYYLNIKDDSNISSHKFIKQD